MNNNDTFLSVQNLKRNIQILQTYMIKEHQINLNQLNINLKEPIFKIMKETYENNKNAPINDLNYKTIAKLRNDVLNMIQTQNRNKGQNKVTQMMNPNQGSGLIGGVNTMPQMTFREDNKNLTTKLYEQRSNNYNEQKQPYMPRFDNNTFTEQPQQQPQQQQLSKKEFHPTVQTNGNNSDMTSKFNDLQKNRELLENEIKNIPQTKIKNFSNIQANISSNISGNEIKATSYNNNPQIIPKQPLNINSNPLHPQQQLETSQPMQQKYNVKLTPSEQQKILLSKDQEPLNNLVKNSNELNKDIPLIINQQFNEQPFIDNKKENQAFAINQILKPSSNELYNQQQMEQMFAMIPQIIRQQLQEITREQGEIKTSNTDFIKEKHDKELKNNKSNHEIVGITNKDRDMQSKSYNNYINNDGKLIDNIINNINNSSSNSSSSYDPRIDLALQSFKLLNDTNIHYITYKRSILINSGDRNTTHYKKRCDFKISVNSSSSDTIQTSLKNIKSIMIGSIIIPMPFNTQAAYDYLNNQDLNFYVTNYYHQYLGLYIDNMEGEYDGTNKNISKNISNLVVDKTIYNQDGRNFIIFKPIQDDKRIFKTPLSSLSSMNIKLLTPNGSLINSYTDSTLEIQSIDLITSGSLIKFTTVSSFTHNELFRYDTIKFSGFNITTTEAPSGNANELIRLNSFLNRGAGHRIYNLGPGNLETINVSSATVNNEPPNDQYAESANDIYRYTYTQFYIQGYSSDTFLDQIQYITASSLSATFINLTAQNIISIQAEYLEIENENEKTGLV
jgi:hypothetical protein